MSRIIPMCDIIGRNSGMCRIIIMIDIVIKKPSPIEMGRRLCLFEVVPHSIYTFIVVRLEILHYDKTMRSFIGGVLRKELPALLRFGDD